MKIDDIKVKFEIDTTELDIALKKAKELNNVLKEINNNKINNNNIEKIQCRCNNDDWINRKDAEYLLDLERIDEAVEQNEYIKYPIKFRK